MSDDILHTGRADIHHPKPARFEPDWAEYARVEVRYPSGVTYTVEMNSQPDCQIEGHLLFERESFELPIEAAAAHRIVAPGDQRADIALKGIVASAVRETRSGSAAEQPLFRGERLRRNHTAQRIGRILASLPEEVYLQLDAGYLEQACAEAAAQVYERAIAAGDARAEYDEATQELATEFADERTLHQETIQERDQLRAEAARVRAAALHDFAVEMRTLAEQAPEGEPAAWPWTAYALAAVKAEEYAARANEPGGSVAASDGGANERWVRADERRRVAEEIAAEIRAELVCCDIYDRDANTPRAGSHHAICFWGEAGARIARHHAAAPAERVQDGPTDTTGTPDPQRYWWHHDGCDSGPVAGAADWPGRPCTGCGMSLGGWTRGAPIAAGSVPSLPEETPDA